MCTNLIDNFGLYRNSNACANHFSSFSGILQSPFFYIKFFKIHFILLLAPAAAVSYRHALFGVEMIESQGQFSSAGLCRRRRTNVRCKHTASGALLSSSVSSFPMLTGMRICSFLSSSCPLGCWLQRAQQHANFFIRNFQNRRNNVTSSSG